MDNMSRQKNTLNTPPCSLVYHLVAPITGILVYLQYLLNDKDIDMDAEVISISHSTYYSSEKLENVMLQTPVLKVLLNKHLLASIYTLVKLHMTSLGVTAITIKFEQVQGK